MKTDIKLNKTQISKISNQVDLLVPRKAKINIAIPLARDNLPGLVSKLTSNVINSFERKISGKGAFRAQKGFTLFIWNENMNGINKITKSLEGVLIDGVTETVKHEIKNKKVDFLKLC